MLHGNTVFWLIENVEHRGSVGTQVGPKPTASTSRSWSFVCLASESTFFWIAHDIISSVFLNTSLTSHSPRVVNEALQASYSDLVTPFSLNHYSEKLNLQSNAQLLMCAERGKFSRVGESLFWWGHWTKDFNLLWKIPFKNCESIFDRMMYPWWVTAASLSEFGDFRIRRSATKPVFCWFYCKFPPLIEDSLSAVVLEDIYDDM